MVQYNIILNISCTDIIVTDIDYLPVGLEFILEPETEPFPYLETFDNPETLTPEMPVLPEQPGSADDNNISWLIWVIISSTVSIASVVIVAIISKKKKN